MYLSAGEERPLKSGLAQYLYLCTSKASKLVYLSAGEEHPLKSGLALAPQEWWGPVAKVSKSQQKSAADVSIRLSIRQHTSAYAYSGPHEWWGLIAKNIKYLVDL